MGLAPHAWRSVTWHERRALRVRPAHRDYLQTEMRAEEWLLVEWPEGEKEPVKYFLSTAPAYASLAPLVFVAKSDKRIERDYQDLKQDFGLGHYEEGPVVPEDYLLRGSPARPAPCARLGLGRVRCAFCRALSAPRDNARTAARSFSELNL
ncbi:hypothetical protein BH10PSE16_BH10PSE16_33400 [soil metagenome]